MARTMHSRILLFVTVGALAAGPALGFALEDKPGAASSQTVVEGLEVHPLVDVPKVGKGAPLYTVEDIQAVEKQAIRDYSDADDAARRCKGGGGKVVFNHGGNISIASLLAEAYGYQQDAALKVRQTADRAKAATEAAAKVRLQAGRGEKSEADVVAAELARQPAVNAFALARAEFGRQDAILSEAHRVLESAGYNKGKAQGGTIDSSEMQMIEDQLRSVLATYDPPAFAGAQRPVAIPERYADLAVEKIVARERSGVKDGGIVVTGMIRNTRNKTIQVPSLSFTAVDRFGYPLKTEYADARNAGRIAPGETKAFAYELKPRPAKISTVVVTFAPDNRETPRLPIGLYC
ncbi:hypothetical protein BH11PSE2_BH11PSE2_02370 [soil metagenome]